jgi:hypothetical protein
MPLYFVALSLFPAHGRTVFPLPSSKTHSITYSLPCSNGVVDGFGLSCSLAESGHAPSPPGGLSVKIASTKQRP